MKQEFGKFSIS